MSLIMHYFLHSTSVFSFYIDVVLTLSIIKMMTLGQAAHIWGLTVYPKKYAHGFVVLYFVVVMLSFIINSHEVLIPIHQGCFAGTGAIVRLPQCQWCKPDGYGKISQCITTTKHSKAKTVCIFLGVYCIMPPPLGVGVIIFSGCPSACPSEAPNTMFCLYTDPMVHLTIHDHFSACPSFCPSVWPERFPDISRKMHGGNGLQILHADVSWPLSELIRFWSWSVNRTHFGTTLT